MVTFVEMGRDRRTYRVMRDGRRGRICLAESAEVEPIVEAVTAYVARRLVERERLLVDDERAVQETQPIEVARTMTASAPAETQAAASAAQTAAPPSGRRRLLGVVAFLFAFGLGAGIGALAVGALIIASAKGMLPL
ncbi:hypothetical protein [Chenggangzhangella methanolivorans]|nr:hypothetical protein [Chenggangzhangella methanolivorans]